MARWAVNWLIGVPAWGERCVPLFIKYALPSIKAAMHGASGHVRFMVHTDCPVQIGNALAGLDHVILPVPPGREPHESFGRGHRKAIASALNGEAVALVNADMVWSVECFSAAEKRFRQGKKAIFVCSSRTLGGVPPIGAKSADLLRWTMERAHPAVEEQFWGTGRTKVPSLLYFRNGDDICCQGFHLHPFAAIKDSTLAFNGVTCDTDLGEAYTDEQIHIVTDKDELAFAELSPPSRTFGTTPHPLSVEYVGYWAKRNALPAHRRMFAHAITLTGSGADIGNKKVCAEVLAAIQ